ncbi:MAG TPA: LON peptidase substrate-binding domain-containing protein [Dehalococcoidia bacterium]|nr:LON peptidase substrate-binding domain-containing protein [Dehalococcoidia bacterium]
MRVPIFPLNLVLFPGQTLPLHIFEERYKAMLQRCLRERIPFGIVLVREGGRMGRGPNQVGTLAQVTQVNEIPEGQCAVPAPHRGNCYHIVCHGAERFRATNFDRREAEYLVGEVELFPDEPAPEPAMLMVAQRVSDLFDEYYRGVIALMGGWQREAVRGERTLMYDIAALSSQTQRSLEAAEMEGSNVRTVSVPVLPDDPESLANVVAAELNNVPMSTKQELLEAPSALARLQREAEILAEEAPQLEERLRLQHRRRYTSFGASS